MKKIMDVSSFRAPVRLWRKKRESVTMSSSKTISKTEWPYPADRPDMATDRYPLVNVPDFGSIAD